MWPFDNPLTPKKKKEGFSSANVPPASSIPNQPPAPTKKPIYDSKSGNLLGYEYSDGSIDLGKGMISNKPVPEQKPFTPPPAPVPPTNQEILAQFGIGTIDPTLTNQTSKDIQRNQELSNALPTLTKQPSINDIITNPAAALGPAAMVVPKVTGTFITGKKSNFINSLNLPRDVQSFLSDYSNEGSYEKIKEDLVTADDQIAMAIESIKLGDDVTDAVLLYNNALSRKSLAMSQLKMLSRDQKKYTSDVRVDMERLQLYFDYGVRVDNLKMANAIAGVQQ